MGSPTGERCRVYGRESRHRVELTRAFEIEATEATHESFLARMGYNPSSQNTCGTCPVNRVSWHEAAAYCNALSQARGLAPCYSCSGQSRTVACTEMPFPTPYQCPGFRLPTEAEWEYAYRAGTTSATYAGPVLQCVGADSVVGSIAWYLDNSGDSVHAVGQKKPNALGLYDMAGNASEWVADAYVEDLGLQLAVDPFSSKGNKRVMRGGSLLSRGGWVRAAMRWGMIPHDGQLLPGAGFRCARSLAPL